MKPTQHPLGRFRLYRPLSAINGLCAILKLVQRKTFPEIADCPKKNGASYEHKLHRFFHSTKPFSPEVISLANFGESDGVAREQPLCEKPRIDKHS